MTAFSDEQLFLLIKQDSRSAFDELYNRHWYTLFNIAYKRLRSKENCSDIVQDIFTDLWNKRTLKHIENVAAYLSTAVRYKVYTLLSEGKAGINFVQPFENLVSSTTADSSFNEKEIKHLLFLWMQTLPEKRREIFRLKYYEGASTRQISEHLNISQKTVQNQLLLAFQDLRLHIAHYLATTGTLIVINIDVLWQGFLSLI
ncbi:RNA polymerase sigma factor [Agriterribacter sp.]|uniref:RNA polymerase sigma factor n=1 Tax=Agriterribacter sp. TaxID=2821509 RepID=UPI002B7188E9|nr:sigma-70 family RNA polymerase sigma factor [Agriterribacter sp.]HTN08317.1 sigma-70 family RNA polymerase sigma factor [Agriterribacter sp.]